MELLVRKVDAQLLEGVGGEVLEAEDVEDVEHHHARAVARRSRRLGATGAQHRVDPAQDPSEAERVERLEDAAKQVVRLLSTQVDAHHLAADFERAVQQQISELGAPKRPGGGREGRRAQPGRGTRDASGVVLELAVPQVEEGGEQAEQGADLVARAPEVAQRRARLAKGCRVVEAARLGGGAVVGVRGAAELAEEAVVARRAREPERLEANERMR